MSERAKNQTRHGGRAKENIEDGSSIAKKRSTAQQRWRILAKALIGPRKPVSVEETSVRRFTSFDLLSVVRLENDSGSSWYEYSARVERKLFSVYVRRVGKSFTANQLIGFNNTGNVCVWPSEECLAYYLLKNREICRNRRVLELGGGMSCLAGVIAAKYCDPSGVTLTDGNATSVDNVRDILTRNGLTDSVECGVLQWAKAARAFRGARAPAAEVISRRARCVLLLSSDPSDRESSWTLLDRTDQSSGDYPNLIFTQSWTSRANEADKPYDVILCADCLFFDEARSDLAETMHGWLANDGVALVMAPRRGSTFRKFAEAAVKRGFVARQIDRYDGKIWSKHLELLDRGQEYCPDLHYPILLELTKQMKTPPG